MVMKKRRGQMLMNPKFLRGVALSVVSSVAFAAGTSGVWAADLAVPRHSHCVAWKTNKTLALVKRATAVGTSCQVTLKAIKKGNKLGAEMQVPIASFDSKEKQRDQEVLKILEAAKQPNIIFKTALLTEADWKKMLGKGSGPVQGVLYVGKRSYPMRFLASVNQVGKDVVVSGKVVTKFTDLGIQPPVVGPGGSIAKVDDYLELHFSFNSKQLQNKGVVPGL